MLKSTIFKTTSAIIASIGTTGLILNELQKNNNSEVITSDELKEDNNKGIFDRKLYCVVCAKPDDLGRSIRITRKAINSFHATVQGAGKCEELTGSKGCSASRGPC